MTTLAIGLVLSSAFTHALWNFVAKRAIGGLSFIWVVALIEVVIYFPVLLIILTQEQNALGAIEIIMIVGSSVLHLVYFLSLTRGYQVGDLSVVYPFSRGIGPLLSTIGAIIILNERPTMIALFGTVLITIGIFGLTGDPRRIRSNNLLKGLFWASVTGVAIAGYTIWDSYAVSTVMLSPIVFQWGLTMGRFFILTPFALKQTDNIKQAWIHDKWKATLVAILSSFSYILMLFALSFSQVSYVAPLRSISILIGVMMGALILKEGNLQHRLGAASIMVIGAIILSLG